MRWQVVRTDAGYHARFLANNGEPIMWSETYVSSADAEHAISLALSDEPLTFETVDER